MSTEASYDDNQSADDTFKILIATDLHLGFDYRKKRGDELEDSFVTFEEILQYSREYEVDFILLGGDLFHDTKPSQTTVLRCMELLRKYCLGPREIKVQFLSDPEIVFRHCSYKTINYEDPNLNVSMPVFSIHGNHDDPSFGAVGSMDLLSVSGLVNYFGKWTDLTKVNIAPLVMKKGRTHVALYGLSYINDQRLSRLIRDCKVTMLRPLEIPECFNIFVLHQNRAKHGEYEYIPENKLPAFLNLVVWGHEHECRITPEFITDTEYFITQPGSSIATSLSEGEAKPKHVGILSINKMKFKMKKLKLKTVRPFVFDNLVLQGDDMQKSYAQSLSDSVYNFVDNYIENELMPRAAAQLTSHPMQPIQPLIRLRIFYSREEEIFDAIRLAQKYCDEVANPMEMIVFRKEKSPTKKIKMSFSSFNDDVDDMAQALCFDDESADWCRTVQGGIKKKFESEDNKNLLSVLSVNGLNEALHRFIDRGDGDAFIEIVSHQVKKTITSLKSNDVDTTDSISKEIEHFREKRMVEEQDDTAEIQEIFNDASRRNKNISEIDLDNEGGNTDKDEPLHKNTKQKGATGRGRGSRGRGRGKAAEKNSLDVTVTSRPSRVPKQTKKKDQYSLQNFMGASGQSKTTAANVFVIDDSD